MTAEPAGSRGTAGVPIRSLWRALIQFEPQKIVTEVAVRNTIGFTCAVIAGTVFASPSTGVVAGLGALNVCYSDGTDPYQFRVRRMLVATLLVGAAVVAGALSAQSDVAAVIVAAMGGFAAGMAIALGTAAGDIGVVTLVTLVVFAAKPLPLVAALEPARLLLRVVCCRRYFRPSCGRSGDTSRNGASSERFITISRGLRKIRHRLRRRRR